MSESKAQSVFISFAGGGSSAAYRDALRSALEARGVRVWGDWTPQAEDWSRTLRRAIDQSDAMIVVLDEASPGSRSLHFELGAAMAKHKRIFPVAPRTLAAAEIPQPIRRLSVLDEPSAAAAGDRIVTLLGQSGQSSGGPRGPQRRETR